MRQRRKSQSALRADVLYDSEMSPFCGVLDEFLARGLFLVLAQTPDGGIELKEGEAHELPLHGRPG